MKKVIFILFITLLLAGCARTAKISRVVPKDTLPSEIKAPALHFTVGEKFTYVAAWKGIHVGTATATIEGITMHNGFEVYKIVVLAKTTDFLSKLFKVEDTFISYMDKEKLISRGFVATIREGRYKKDLVVEYDSQNRTATYRNLLDGSIKKAPIEESVQDPISAAYFLRTIPVAVGDKINMIVNLNEKNYEITGDIEKQSVANIPELGTFSAFLIRPYVKLRGKLERRGKAWGYLSSDEKRLVLYLVIKVLEIPWIGEVTATLKNIEYVSSSQN